MAHVGQEVALGAVGLLGVLLGLAQLDLLLLQLGDVLEADQQALRLLAAALHRCAVDEERAQLAGTVLQTHEAVAQWLTVAQCRAPGTGVGREARPVRAGPGEGGRLLAEQRFGGLPHHPREGLVRQHDVALGIDHQQTFRQRVERGAHASRDGPRRIELPQHAPEIEIEHDHAHHHDEGDHLQPRLAQVAHDPGLLQRLEAQLHAAPLLAFRQDRDQDLRVGGKPVLELVPVLHVVADHRDRFAVGLDHCRRQQVGVALHRELQHRFGAFHVRLADQRRGGDRNRLGERRAPLADGRVVIGDVAEVHRQQHHAGEQ